MLFNSVNFFLLLIATALLYWRSSHLFWRQCCLLAASLIFYAFWFWPYLLLLFALSLVAYLGALQIDKRNRKALPSAVICLLTILGIFKYTQFSLDLVGEAARSIGLSTTSFEVNILVPLGISFICFQLIGYLVDVARQKVAAESNFRIFLLFIAFFPQLVAGPICRAEQLMPQLKEKPSFDRERFCGAILLLAVGLVLKTGFADGLAPFVDKIFSASNYAEEPALIAAVSFGVQIFCDFWGYSTMAVGAAQLFGIEVPINFYLPYLSTSLREFWRRWHITLSYWFRDYLYIPLGGSRNGQLATARNLLIVMGLCGLWHGAALTFVAWGLLHGLYLVVERWLVSSVNWPLATRLQSSNWPVAKYSLAAGQWLITMSFITTTWIFFRAQSMGEALSFTQAAWAIPGGLALEQVPNSVWRLLLVFALVQVPIQKLIDTLLTSRLDINWQLILAGWLFAFAVVMSAGESFEFIYFEF